MSADNLVVTLYTVRTADGKFFGGFDAKKGESTFVDDPRAAKKFTNKYDIRLRPEETLVELKVDLSSTNVKVSEPFRPQRRKQAAPR